MDDGLAAEAARLTEMVGGLSRRVELLAQHSAQLTASNIRLQESNTKLELSNVGLDQRASAAQRRGRVNRIMIMATIFGLILDLGLSGLFVVQHVAQAKTNRHVACQDALRAKGSRLADSDRANTTTLIVVVSSGQIKTRAQYKAAFTRFKTIADANTAARKKLGTNSSAVCD